MILSLNSCNIKTQENIKSKNLNEEIMSKKIGKQMKEANSVKYNNQFGFPDTMYATFNNEQIMITPEGKIFKNKSLYLDLLLEDKNFLIEELYFIFEKEYIVAIYIETDMDCAGCVAKMISLKDKKINWTLNCGGFNMSIPIYDEKYLYVSTIGGIYKIDYKKGKFDWKFEDLYDRGKYNSFNQPKFLNDTLLIFTSERHDKNYLDTIMIDDKNRKIILKQ